MIDKATWYVSFDIPKSAKSSGRLAPRATEIFRSETEAKDFARLKFTEGIRVNAGTINPHVPKHVVSSVDVQDWLDQDSMVAYPSAG
jgi:hypothetical protein